MNKALIKDVKEAVIESLENPKYKWRTIDGVSKEIRIDPDIVQEVIEKNRGIVIKSAYTSKSGQSLFTTRSHFLKKASFLDKTFGAVKNRLE